MRLRALTGFCNAGRHFNRLIRPGTLSRPTNLRTMVRQGRISNEAFDRPIEPRPGVILENLRIRDIAAQRVHALVAGLIGHLEDRCTPCGGAGQKSRSQGVAGECRGSRPTREA
jgi:hypothetical protein